MLRQLKPFATTTSLLLLIAYFAYHGFTGDRGLLLQSQRQATLAARHAELNTVRTERMDLEARARLLRDESLSADLLEERARSLLGLADPRDYVIRLTR